MGQPGGISGAAGRDVELELLYRGEVARLTTQDRDILVMKWMGWSHKDLLQCPAGILKRIWQHIKAEGKAAQAERAKPK